MHPSPKLSIKNWSEEDRPREKLLQKGKSVLSDAELLSILIGSGTREESAVELSRRLLRENENSLIRLAKRSANELCKFKGLGSAKAVTIVAALELGRRRKLEEPVEKPKITDSISGFHYIAPVLQDLDHEEFWIILLSRSNSIMGKVQISSGGMAGTIVDPKIIFKVALDHKAHGLIICHNHPSGSLKPSQADLQLTKKIVASGQLLDIETLDHLIVTSEGYFSFADAGLL